ncbi:MAG TPA: hypothetical protein VH583_07985 [Vicinamibacterales bacterium]|jgi:tetratricopeptide (TPR) repeat protein
MILALMAAAIVLGGPAAATDKLSPRMARLDAWLLALREHEPGTGDAAAVRAGAWSSDDIRLLWLDTNAFIRLLRCPKCGVAPVAWLGDRSGTRRTSTVQYTNSELATLRDLSRSHQDGPWSEDKINILLKRGALLHTDIAMYVQPDGAPVHTGPPRTNGPLSFVMRSSDGHQTSVVDVAAHWELARSLLDLIAASKGGLASGPSQDPDVRVWYQATLAYMQAAAYYDTLHFDHALRLFPDAADVQFQNACLHETLASTRIQAAVRSASSGITFDVKSGRAELEIAERHFRRSLELDSSVVEARVRLGHVLSGLGRYADAVTELGHAGVEDEEPWLRYDAAMFLGDAQRAIGRRDEARASFERAAALFPRAQSPMIALSQLARESGRRESALAEIQPMLALEPAEERRPDPWWDYYLTPGRNADELLDALYRRFGRTSR